MGLLVVLDDVVCLGDPLAFAARSEILFELFRMFSSDHSPAQAKDELSPQPAAGPQPEERPPCEPRGHLLQTPGIQTTQPPDRTLTTSQRTEEQEAKR